MKMKAFCQLIRYVNLVSIFLFSFFSSNAQNKYTLQNDSLEIEWKVDENGYRIRSLNLKTSKQNVPLKNLLGEYTILFSEKMPSKEVNWKDFPPYVKNFPDSSYILIHNRWRESLRPVAMNTAGEKFSFYPQYIMKDKDFLTFTQDIDEAQVKAVWYLDKQYQNDIVVEIELLAKKDGFFSIQSPTLFSIEKDIISWGMVPGHFQGNTLENNLILSYGYGQGIPTYPVIARDRTASTLCPLISMDNVTIAVIPEPGTARDPWFHDSFTQNDWFLGLSLMNRERQIFPTLYHPILGEKKSYLKNGDKKIFKFRYTLKKSDWYDVYKHAVYDIYKFDDFLDKKTTRNSLTDRILGMMDYVRNDSLSLWHVFDFNGLKIGAQEYNGPVYGSNKDAVKNSDYGAMWMLAHLTKDKILAENRLPYARNFKIAQQEKQDDFFKGAAKGQYYLYDKKIFTDEWGDYVEPIALTYYMLLDIGNILLFDPKDEELKENLRMAADRLLSWQHKDGSWPVAFDHQTHETKFNDLKDLRPTFYGLIVAYQILGDKKYLEGSKKGADWFIENALNQGHYLGVCGDFRFVPDFATGQSAQALLDLYDITKDEKYKESAIKTARQYTTSIFTHPIPSNQEKIVKNRILKDWEISQAGLSFEHGGTLGSAAKHGPILLASHAGLFVRMFDLTDDSIFIDMARAAALGRDAFVNKNNNVASYYWDGFDNGPGSFPHHAWWQIGWIYDYLVSEAELRSSHRIVFPRGFITPKVGPHKSLGFASGVIDGTKSDLLLKKNLVKLNNPNVDYLTAINRDKKELFVILLNQQNKTNEVHLEVFPQEIRLNKVYKPILKKVSISPFDIKIEKFDL